MTTELENTPQEDSPGKVLHQITYKTILNLQFNIKYRK